MEHYDAQWGEARNDEERFEACVHDLEDLPEALQTFESRLALGRAYSNSAALGEGRRLAASDAVDLTLMARATAVFERLRREGENDWRRWRRLRPDDAQALELSDKIAQWFAHAWRVPGNYMDWARFARVARENVKRVGRSRATFAAPVHPPS